MDYDSTLKYYSEPITSSYFMRVVLAGDRESFPGFSRKAFLFFTVVKVELPRSATTIYIIETKGGKFSCTFKRSRLPVCTVGVFRQRSRLIVSKQWNIMVFCQHRSRYIPFSFTSIYFMMEHAIDCIINLN